MTGIPDAWGSSGYLVLSQACQKAEELHERFERHGRQTDLDAAVAGFSMVLDLASNVDLRSAATNGLGTALWSRYELHGQPADLDEAIRLFDEALAMYPDEETPFSAAFRANLAGALRARWRRSRSHDDLTRSVDLVRAAVEATPRGNSRRSARLNNLAIALTALHTHYQDSSALTEAIQVYREAMDCAQDGDSNGLWARSNLAEALRARYLAVVDRDVSVLDEAVEQARKVLADAPRNHLYPRFQSNLAIILLSRFHARGRPADLAEAAELSQAAVKATPAGRPDLAERLSILTRIQYDELVRFAGPHLAEPYSTTMRWTASGTRRSPRRGWRLGRDRQPRAERTAADRVIRSAAALAAVVPDGHILHADALLQQGVALGHRSVIDGDPAFLAEAIACFRQVARNPAAPASTRISAGWRWALAEMAASGGSDWTASMEPFELAVSLIPQTAHRRVTHADRERHLTGFAGLARDAAACAVALGKSELAVQLLEHGRGVLLGQALDSRTELTELRRRRPDLASRFEALRSALDSPEGLGFTAGRAEGDAASPAGVPGEERHHLAEEWERLLDTIRGLDGLAGFLRPPEIDDMVAAVSGLGRLAIVNVSPLRCDALLIAQGRVEALPLPRLSHPELVRRVDGYRAALARVRDSVVPAEERDSAQHQIHETLAWLWWSVAEPVLDALNLLPSAYAAGQPERSLPRLWWVPTGALTSLPLHAAGVHGVPGACVLDQVISSYAPTVRSLTSARRPTEPTEPTAKGSAHRRGRRPPEPLVVAVPSAPGVPDLPGVREEIALLTKRYPGSRVLTGAQAVRKAVLDALPQHPWTHFACHAVSTVEGAATGRLILHDHRSAPLTVADIARLRLDDAEIAFLSACDTSVAREGLSDEALHITGACHMAGYRHVIGTLWRVKDASAPKVADSFYSALSAAGPEPSAVSSALHAAVNTLRLTYPDAPDLWAAYIHVGP